MNFQNQNIILVRYMRKITKYDQFLQNSKNRSSGRMRTIDTDLERSDVILFKNITY